MFERLRGWLRRRPDVETTPVALARGAVDHVIIIDGSMSTLEPGCETNAGLIYKLLCDVAPLKNLSLRYEPGIQWRSWREVRDVIEGRGINRQIQRVYGFLASRYRPGDRIFLIGYSRGAYAVRSLAGVIDRMGLLRADHATQRNVRQVYRGYQDGGDAEAAGVFRALHCHEDVAIEMVGVFDTVKSLGLRVPFFWRWLKEPQPFHNHALGHHIRHGFQALALDETRSAFAPVMWDSEADFPGIVEQIWFRGVHPDIGGHLDGFHNARPLSNIPLVWMLDKAARCGLPLPSGWRAQFDCDPGAPSVGSFRKWGKFFLTRRRRVVGRDASEAVHESAGG